MPSPGKREITSNGLVMPVGLGDEQDDKHNWPAFDQMLSGTHPLVKLPRLNAQNQVVDAQGQPVGGAVPWQANQVVSPWAGAVLPTGTDAINEWTSAGSSGAVISSDTNVKFGGRPTTRVTFGGAPSGTAFEVGVSGASVAIRGVARELLSGYAVVAVNGTAPITAAKLYIGDAGYANYYEVNITNNALNAVKDIGNGWRLLMADCSLAGVVSVQGAPNLDGLKRMKVTCFSDANPPSGSVWVGFAGVVKKPKPTVVLTCDDGYSEWASYLFPAMKERNVPGSFSIDAGYVSAPGFMTEQQFRTSLATYGDLIEYVNHGANNVAYAPASFAQYTANILQCDALLKEWGVTDESRKLHTYVQGQFDQSLIDWLVSNGFKAAREVGASNRSQFHLAAHLGIPDVNRNSRYAIPAGCNLSNAQPVATVIDYIEEAKLRGSAFFLMGHEFKVAPGPQAYVAGYHATHGMSNLLDYLAAERDAGRIDLVKWSTYVESMSLGRPVVGVS